MKAAIPEMLPMASKFLVGNIDALIMIAFGLYFAVLGHRYQKSPPPPPPGKMPEPTERRDKRYKIFRWCGWVMVVTGILRLFIR